MSATAWSLTAFVVIFLGMIAMYVGLIVHSVPWMLVALAFVAAGTITKLKTQKAYRQEIGSHPDASTKTD